MPRKRKKSPTISPALMITLIAVFIGTLWFTIGDHAMNKPDQPVIAPSSLPGADDLTTVIDNNPTKLPSRLLIKRGMKISFNPQTHTPNWVSWELTGAETKGKQPRSDKFLQDPHVKSSATPGDYKMSGYDRGHMAPAGDMKWDAEAMAETFLMTNIAPQAHRLNAGPWKTLEEKCRLWAQTDSAIIIVCGPVNNEQPIEYIGATKVAVPRQFFKVILSPYANPPRAIGFLFANGENPGGIQPAAKSVDEIEAITGLDFFSRLPDSIETQIETQNRFHQWPTHP